LASSFVVQAIHAGARRAFKWSSRKKGRALR
jgi:hypothetical protein